MPSPNRLVAKVYGVIVAYQSLLTEMDGAIAISSKNKAFCALGQAIHDVEDEARAVNAQAAGAQTCRVCGTPVSCPCGVGIGT